MNIKKKKSLSYFSIIKFIKKIKTSEIYCYKIIMNNETKINEKTLEKVTTLSLNSLDDLIINNFSENFLNLAQKTNENKKAADSSFSNLTNNQQPQISDKNYENHQLQISQSQKKTLEKDVISYNNLNIGEVIEKNDNFDKNIDINDKDEYKINNILEGLNNYPHNDSDNSTKTISTSSLFKPSQNDTSSEFLIKNFSELTTKIIQKYTDENKLPQSDQNYSLIEDLIILKETISKTICFKFFVDLSNHKFLKYRRAQSLKDRYRIFLKNLKIIDLKNIMAYIESHSSLDLRNYCLFFEGLKEKKIFKKITLMNLKQKNHNVPQQLIKRVMKPDNENVISSFLEDDPIDFHSSSNEKNVNKCNKKLSNNEEKDNVFLSKDVFTEGKDAKDSVPKHQTTIDYAFQKSILKKHSLTQKIDLSSVKYDDQTIFNSRINALKNRLKLHNPNSNLALKRKDSPSTITNLRYNFHSLKFSCPHNRDYFLGSCLDIISKKFKENIENEVETHFSNLLIISDLEKKNIFEVNGKYDELVIEKCLDLSQKFKKPLKDIVFLLESVNGNIHDLEIFLKGSEKNVTIIWSCEDDELLQSIELENSLDFRILLRYKSIEKIKERIKFKGFVFPFEL